MSETRQRWRLTFRRDEEARYLAHLDAVRLWERALRRGAIPIATSEGFNPRPRLIFAAPLPLGMLAEHELADLFLAERLTLPDLRARLERSMPRGYRLLELRDEWVGAPALATQLVAADYRLQLLGLSDQALGAAIRRLLGAARLDREKRREAKAVAYDLRPLIVDLHLGGDGRPVETLEAGGAVASSPDSGSLLAPRAALESDPDPAMPSLSGSPFGQVPLPEGQAVSLWMRLRHSQDRGSGRVEEVVAALLDTLPDGLDRRPSPEMVLPVRERLWLGGELPAGDG